MDCDELAMQRWLDDGGSCVEKECVTFKSASLPELNDLYSKDEKESDVAVVTNQPHFYIVHRYSQGICAPGEEISAVLFEYAERLFQLPLGLTERFVFDFVAQRRLALDSLQIVSGLSGDRFYSQHAENSGRKQIKKIRRPTIKVSAQRIRDAMSSIFSCAKADYDPYRVLRSYFAEGTNRVLYKLCGHVQWQHPSR